MVFFYYIEVFCLSGKTDLCPSDYFWDVIIERESTAFRRTMIDFPELMAVNYILTSRSEDRVAL